MGGPALGAGCRAAGPPSSAAAAGAARPGRWLPADPGNKATRQLAFSADSAFIAIEAKAEGAGAAPRLAAGTGWGPRLREHLVFDLGPPAWAASASTLAAAPISPADWARHFGGGLPYVCR